MKVLRKTFAAMLVIGLALCAAAGCAEKSPRETEEWELVVYRQAVELGFEGSFEEFMQTVTGKDGASVAAAFVNENGELILELSDGNSVNAGVVKGEDGKEGTDGKDGSVWYCGEGVPSDGLGKETDLYLDTETYDIYRKSESWEKTGNIRGENALEGTAKVTYDCAGGAFENGEESLSEILPQGACASLPVPVREHCVFAGWYAGEGAFADKMTAFTPVFADIALTARWMPQPELRYLTPGVLQAEEGNLLPEGKAEISGLYGVYFYECTVNGAPVGENFRCTVAEKSLGQWEISVESASSLPIGSYAVKVVLYSGYTQAEATFRYTVTAAPAHEFGEIVLNGNEIAERAVTLSVGDDCELTLRLKSSYGSAACAIRIGETRYDLKEGEDNAFAAEEYTIVAALTGDGTDAKIEICLFFSVAGEYDFSVISEAENGASATAELRFTVLP